jgi:hypothetical protein
MQMLKSIVCGLRADITLFLIACVIFLPTAAWAAFSLSVTPYEGGYDLRYGKIASVDGRVNKELVVRVTSDQNVRYQLVQSFFEPPSTPEGASLMPGSFFVYALRGTNQYGTVNVEQGTPVGMGRQILYTSGSSGPSDSFTLVYGITLPPDTAAGIYRGRIGFSLEPIDSTLSPQSAILNIYLEVYGQGGIKITTSSGIKTLSLKPGDPEISTGRAIFEITGSRGRQFRILQSADAQPVSAAGEVLNWESVRYAGFDARSGIAISTPVELSDKQQVVYTSSASGDADAFSLEYSLGDLSAQKSGKYRAQLKFFLQDASSGQLEVLDTIALEIDNPRVFDLVVTPEGGGSIRFWDVRPLQPPKIQEAIFEIKTNIGRQYQVTQNVASPLTNREGYMIPDANFTVQQFSLETKGDLKFLEKTPIKQGQSVIFISDKDGSADKFKVIYELTIPRDVRGGDYSTTFSYSIVEI